MKLHISMMVVLSLIVWTGCVTNEPLSEEWLAAEKEAAELSYSYTNGMAWPTMSGQTETVMAPGMQIRATTTDNEILIVAGPGYQRSYTWDGATRSALLWSRNERWYGSLGIYFPGLGQHWKSNNGITRGVLNEGILWFDGEDSALHYLQKIQPLKKCVYTQDGLVVAWEKVPGRKQLNVDVWQFMVRGSKPTNLPFSCANCIQIVHRLP